jgi:uncharacterized membrane protein required for colicin V production
MKVDQFNFSWIDLVIVGILIVGVIRGRSRGISEELLDVFKWMFVVIVGALAYEPLGSLLAENTMFSRLAAYVAMYTSVALLLLLIFSFIRQQVGGKITGTDFFGNSEYYLGMCAGAVRYACVTLAVMALLNARFYSPAEVQAQIKYQNDNYGSMYFPTLCTVQHEVFVQSFIGRLTGDYLRLALIKPTAPEEKGLSRAGIARRHEQNVYEVLDKK